MKLRISILLLLLMMTQVALVFHAWQLAITFGGCFLFLLLMFNIDDK